MCVEGTFGLDIYNPNGCTKCFCFGRSTKCSEANLSWSQLRLNSSRHVTFNSSSNEAAINFYNISNENYPIIPNFYGNLSMQWKPLKVPLYWKLHPIFNGDQVLSYGGFLRFNLESIKSDSITQKFRQYPWVILVGNGIYLSYKTTMEPIKDHFEIKLHESLWKGVWPRTDEVSRELFMIALQNITDILIKSTNYLKYTFIS